jgi:trimethylamine--corrinoid protein Co-methyltransferase
VVNSEIDQRVDAVEGAELLLSNTNKSGGTGVRCPEQVKYFEEINCICAKHGDQRRFTQAGGCLTTPLTLGHRTAGIIEEYLDLGYRDFGFSSMPIAGGNAPVTTAGCAALGVAELLGGSLVARAINAQMAGTGVGMIISGTMDMTRGRASFCSPQALLQDALIHRVFQRLYGIGVSLDNTAGYINAKMPGLQCAYERTFKQMALAGVAGALGMHAGSLDGAAIFSPVQAMIDVELCRGLWEFYKGVNVSDDTLALDEIERIGVGRGESFFDSEHTLKHFREALWLPKLLNVSMWEDGREAAREREMLEKAECKWREILAGWKRPEINEAMIAEIHEVVKRAKREIPQRCG